MRLARLQHNADLVTGVHVRRVGGRQPRIVRREDTGLWGDDQALADIQVLRVEVLTVVDGRHVGAPPGSLKLPNNVIILRG